MFYKIPTSETARPKNKHIENFDRVKLPSSGLHQFTLLPGVTGCIHFLIIPRIHWLLPKVFIFAHFIFKKFALLKSSDIKLSFICVLAVGISSVNYPGLLSTFSLCLSTPLFTPRIPDVALNPHHRV